MGDEEGHAHEEDVSDEEEEEELDEANMDPEWLALRAMLQEAREQGLMGNEGVDAEEDAEQHDGNEETMLILQSLFDCTEAGDEEPLTQLLDELKDAALVLINTPHPSDGDTLIHIASLYGHESLVTLLIERGAKPGAVNLQDGSTPLHDASAGGYLEICELLIKKAPESVTIADFDKDTPLHCAARGNHVPVVKLLLEHGADQSSLNNDGKTPAAEAEDREVVTILVRKP